MGIPPKSPHLTPHTDHHITVNALHESKLSHNQLLCYMWEALHCPSLITHINSRNEVGSSQLAEACGRHSSLVPAGRWMAGFSSVVPTLVVVYSA